jgi:SAM-dependent methyltransferase
VDFREFYQDHLTDNPVLDHRLQRVVTHVERLAPPTLLDVGCGRATLLSELARRMPATKLAGVDVRDETVGPFDYRSADITAGLPWEAESFDMVTFGEVIEHVPDPDALLGEIWRVLKPGGHLVVTTPNLVSWSNRILVPLGIQPLFTETSTKQNLGRRWRILGQGNDVQGHLKIFTHRSLSEILTLNGFTVVQKDGSPTKFPGPLAVIDRACAGILPLASVLVYLAKKPR